ncbi:hypothetical protein BGZ65_009271, partial [Modicella reniformis]
MFGAMFWGMLADAYGRKQAFNLTLIVTTFFGIAASFAPSYWVLCVLILFLGFGVGGNMPVDGALFLEFTPHKNQYLLTFLSIFFSFGAVAASLLGYFLLPSYSCETRVEGGCPENGWRYMLLALGGVTLSMVVGRVILFRLEESPKFLLNHNRHEEAALVLRRIFKINHGTPQSEGFEENIETLTTRFSHAESFSIDSSSDDEASAGDPRSPTDSISGTHLLQHQGAVRTQGIHGVLFLRYLRQLNRKLDIIMGRLRPLLLPRFRLSTILIWIIWALVAFAYTSFNVFLPKFFRNMGKA